MLNSMICLESIFHKRLSSGKKISINVQSEHVSITLQGSPLVWKMRTGTFLISPDKTIFVNFEEVFPNELEFDEFKELLRYTEIVTEGFDLTRANLLLGA
ncbi:hypothetical protein [Citrobacter phage Ci1]|nr:hypothetical protein [Citrobacter phage Ci1]